MGVEQRLTYKKVRIDIDSVVTYGLGYTKQSPHDALDSEPELQWRLGYLKFLVSEDSEVMENIFSIRGLVDDAGRLGLRGTDYFSLTAQTPQALKELVERYQPMKTEISEGLTSKGNTRQVLREDLIQIMDPSVRDEFKRFVESAFPVEVNAIGKDETPEID